MDIYLHQTHHQVANFTSVFNHLQDTIEDNQEGIHVFPELFLTGYPLQDLCLQKIFIDKYLSFLEKVRGLAKNINEKSIYIFGGLDYQISSSGIVDSIKNVVFRLDAHGLSSIYTKQLLPNYDIFDEQKYFSAGNESLITEIDGKKVGILICEDMWASSFHKTDPVEKLKLLCQEESVELDFILNLSASPWVLGKCEKRETRAKQISNYFNCPFIYTNRVGGEDEILFDGQSFICDGVKTIYKASMYQSETLYFSLSDIKFEYNTTKEISNELTWESLFNSRLKDGKLKELSDDDCNKIIRSLIFGVQDYASKCGFKKFTIALSGGMDSALVLTLIRMGLKEGQSLEAVYMPSIYSSPLSWKLSLELCQNLGVPLKSLPIKFLHSTVKNLFDQSYCEPFEGVADENIQSRLRGSLLYARSNQTNSMVINTSNKSELAVGYSTQYGDSVGAISMLGDLYKSEVFQIAKYINRKNKSIIPEEIISRPPSAELREGQVDSETLPDYDVLDTILDGILSYRYSKDDLKALNINTEDIEKVFNLYAKTEFKRYQFCPIIKITTKSFGFGYRIPISKDINIYK